MKYCNDYAALLDLYVDGELDAENILRVQAHLDQCDGCRQYVDDALAMRAAFPDAEETVLPQHFHENVMSAIAAQSRAQKKANDRRRVFKTLMPLAAACFAVVIVVQSGGMGAKKESAAQSPQVWSEDVKTYSATAKEAPAAAAIAPRAESSLTADNAAPAAEAPQASDPVSDAAPSETEAAIEREASAVRDFFYGSAKEKKAAEASFFALVHLDEAAKDLPPLAELTPMTLEDGSEYYVLSGAEYDVLCESLYALRLSLTAEFFDNDSDTALVVIQTQ